MLSLKGIVYWTFALGLCAVASGFLDQNDIVTKLNLLENRTRYLEQDIKVKNDLTQFLQSNVVALNSSLTFERNKTATLEVKVKDLETRLANQMASSGELAGDVKSVKNLANTLKTDLAQTKQDVQTQMSSINNLNTTALQSIKQVSHRLDSVDMNITTLQQTIAQAANGPQIYFTYRNSDPQIPANPNSPLKFHGRVANQGNGFNDATGEFVAPTDGLYWFSLTLGVAASDFLNCYIVQNSQLYLIEVFSSAYSAYTSASSAVTVYLTTGEKIAVAGCHGNGSISGYKSSFSGMLVHED